jgi:hypothetical protein
VWIEEFRALFPLIIEERYSSRQDLEAVEREVAKVHSGTHIGSDELCAIENSRSWDYLNWWRKLGPTVGEPIPMPPDLSSPEAKEPIIRVLYGRLKHIEVVSVLLRFVRPEEFAILSPPVSSLLALPYEKDHVAHYLKYLIILDGFRNNYSGLARIADVDMALWSAAHADWNYPALIDEMYEDPYFQQVRLTNLLEGLGRHWRQSGHHRMLLADSLLRADYELAAVVTGVVYETVVNEIADRIGIHRRIDKRGKVVTGERVRTLSKQTKIDGLSVPPQSFEKWWKMRGRAVHCDPPLSQEEARGFVREIEGLLRAIKNWQKTPIP